RRRAARAADRRAGRRADRAADRPADDAATDRAGRAAADRAGLVALAAVVTRCRPAGIGHPAIPIGPIHRAGGRPGAGPVHVAGVRDAVGAHVRAAVAVEDLARLVRLL